MFLWHHWLSFGIDPEMSLSGLPFGKCLNVCKSSFAACNLFSDWNCYYKNEKSLCDFCEHFKIVLSNNLNIYLVSSMWGSLIKKKKDQVLVPNFKEWPARDMQIIVYHVIRTVKGVCTVLWDDHFGRKKKKTVSKNQRTYKKIIEGTLELSVVW